MFDVASRFVAEPEFLVQGSLWLIGLGIVGAAAAAVVGFLDFATIPSGTPAFRTALIHMSLNLSITVAYAVNFFWRMPATDQPAGVATGPLLLSLVSLAALGVSGFLGGKLAYRYGVRVADEVAQADGFRSVTKDNGGA